MKLAEVLTEFGVAGGVVGLRPLGSLADAVTGLGPPGRGGPLFDGKAWPQWFMFGDATIEVCGCELINAVSMRTWYEEVRVPGVRPGELHILPAAVGFGELERALAGVGVGWRRIRESEDSFAMEVEPAGRPELTVVFTFTTDEGEPEGLLYSVHAREHVHACPSGTSA
ncbi:hypothetical protein [Streptomyces rubellomurinus]|uniref:Uncharacterized protein n=1 Tax=Streptomyces sp. Y1 TaxID=3238634 RepID=A0AB39TS83_9ACTN